MFGKSSEKYLMIVGVFAIVLIDCCYSSTFITPPITHPGKLMLFPSFISSIYFGSMCDYLAHMTHHVYSSELYKIQ